MTTKELFGDVIHRYTREDCLRDGLLIDATAMAREAGFTVPVALSRAVWSNYVEVPAGVVCQDEEGRLWDVLWMLFCAIRRAGSADLLVYDVYVRNTNRRRPKRVRLKAVCGPNDDGTPCVTILLPCED